MTKDVKYPGATSQSQLEINLNFQEAIWKKITGLRIQGGYTVSTHDRATAVPANSLKLVLDPNENATGPEGSTLICRGDALISGNPHKVAAFRVAVVEEEEE